MGRGAWLKFIFAFYGPVFIYRLVGGRILGGISRFLGEQKGESVITESPKGRIAENFGRIQRVITQTCLKNEDRGDHFSEVTFKGGIG